MSRVGIVTVTYNSASVLADFLGSVWKQTYRDFFLYVVDSGSTDNTIDILAGTSDSRVRAIVTGKNIGFAAGSNLGIKMALEEKCDAIMLLNNDIVFGPELFQNLLEGLETHNCDMTTPKMLYYNCPNTIWAAGGHLNKWLGYRNHNDRADQVDDGRLDQPRRVTFTPFCCILMRRSVIETLGYLDERYFVYTEDADYCFRAMKSGLSLWYLPEARLWHKVSSLTGGGGTPFLIRYCTRNRTYFQYKHLSASYARFWNTLYWIYQYARYRLGKDSRETWQLKCAAMRDGLNLYMAYISSRER